MTRTRILALAAAALTVLCLSACGDTVETSSAPEGIATFGFDVDPSAQPSQPENIQQNPQQGGANIPASAPASDTSGQQPGVFTEDNTGSTPVPSPSPTTAPAAATGQGSGNGGSNPGGTVTAQPTARPTTRPTTQPTTRPTTQPPAQTSPGPSESVITEMPQNTEPAPASTANARQASEYRGHSLRELIDALGYPSSSEYDDVDPDDPESDRIGTLYYSGFIVTTYQDRATGKETVTAVIER